MNTNIKPSIKVVINYINKYLLQQTKVKLNITRAEIWEGEEEKEGVCLTSLVCRKWGGECGIYRKEEGTKVKRKILK